MEVRLLNSWWMSVVTVCVAHHSPFPLSQSLNTNPWVFQNANGSVKATATVPGGIYTDLRKAGILTEDIFYRFNDEEYRWVAKDNWTFSTYFDVQSKILEKKNIFLEFEGLDTVAQVFLNEKLLGETNNMFVSYHFDVKPILQGKNNSLEVRFTSPILAAQQSFEKSEYLVPPKCVPAEYRGECHVNYLRKMQASFAWDWGPAFPSVGIWKNVSLHAYNSAFARHITVETRPEPSDWKVSVTLHVNVTGSTSGTLTASLVVDDMRKITSERQVTLSPEDSSPTLVFSVPKDMVQVWWPNGHGSQPLYRLTVRLVSEQEVTQKTVMIGFRTVNLVQVEAVPGQPDKGLTFYFRVNGEAIFAKGSNYIPLHILPELSAEPSRLRQLLTSARDANMNMLRVWGGGLYESDLFYQMCDELGILIWQDLMFACSMYPTDEAFLESVAREVTQQVERLQHHPCIAIWAGNNENEAALSGNWYNTQANFSLYKNDYIKLYVNTIRPIIHQIDKTRSYVESSPSNGLQSEKEGYVASNPYDNKFGDVHWYMYSMNLWNSAIFPKTRFASEYGVMSLPSLESFTNITIPEDLSLDSDFINRRQHHLTGYVQMIHEIKSNLYLPEDVDLETFIYLTQINQAMSIKTETESYRRGRSYLDAVGEGLTMGALYWQLNDVWQAPSWASIEYSGKWKMLHYFAVDFFSPVLVSPYRDITDELRVHVISDLRMHTSLDLVMQLKLYSWQSLTPVLVHQYPFTMEGAGVVEIAKWDVASFLRSVEGCTQGSQPEKNCFFHFSLLGNNSSMSVGPDNYYFPSPLHSISSPARADVKVMDIKPMKNSHELIVTLTTDVIAAFVWLDSLEIPGHFSHNGFLMVTNKTQLTFTSAQPIDLDLFKKSLKIKSLQYHK